MISDSVRSTLPPRRGRGADHDRALRGTSSGTRPSRSLAAPPFRRARTPSDAATQIAGVFGNVDLLHRLARVDRRVTRRACRRRPRARCNRTRAPTPSFAATRGARSLPSDDAGNSTTAGFACSIAARSRACSPPRRSSRSSDSSRPRCDRRRQRTERRRAGIGRARSTATTSPPKLAFRRAASPSTSTGNRADLAVALLDEHENAHRTLASSRSTRSSSGIPSTPWPTMRPGRARRRQLECDDRQAGLAAVSAPSRRSASSSRP